MVKSLILAIAFAAAAVPAAAQTVNDVDTFHRAEDAMRSGDWTAALATAESVSPVARDIIEWHRLRAGEGDFDAAQRFLARRPDWPGLKLLRKRSEASLPMGTRADEVLAFFAPEPPQTGTGAMALIAAYRAKGMQADAEAEAVRTWLTQVLSADDEAQLLASYGETLKKHHVARLEMLLWRDASSAAERMYPLVDSGHRALAKARLALRDDKHGVDALVAAVPTSLADDPGLAFERMQWRARKGRNDSAIELILAQDSKHLGKPGYWAGWRRAFARSEMLAGHSKTAYRLASEHGLKSGSSYAELEWLAGYIALTDRHDPKTALMHFRRFRAAVGTPISLGRAGYWEGRADEALGDAENAHLAYAFGGEYQTSFYGLLAAERAGLPMDPELTGQTDYPDWKTTRFAASSVFAAARLFIRAGERNLAEQFLTHLTESLAEPEIGSLGAFAVSQGEPHLAVMIAKQAARQGIVVPAAYYPLVDLGIGQLPVPRELTLAIARRESEFDPAVVSGVGARGLMQLMPATAKEVAGTIDVTYSRDRLVDDPIYNARLGTAYLDQLMTQFDGNVVLVAAGYNAGPGRLTDWTGSLGDPRLAGTDPIDWIERIPFDETRNYVMRVAESLPIYRARLTGQVQPLTLSAELAAAPGHAQSAALDDTARPRPRPRAMLD